MRIQISRPPSSARTLRSLIVNPPANSNNAEYHRAIVGCVNIPRRTCGIDRAYRSCPERRLCQPVCRSVRRSTRGNLNRAIAQYLQPARL